MRIAERILIVVEKNGGNMSDFARNLNVSPAYISKLKNNPERNPSDRFLKDICRTYHINEEWLLTGEGEMENYPADEVGAIVGELIADADSPMHDMILRILKGYQKLSPNEKEVVDKLIDEVCKKDRA